MREEAERLVREEGWTKAALNNMPKIDSFLRESQRLNPGGSCMYPIHSVCAGADPHTVVMQRRVVSKDGFRFSDGTVLPHGAFMSIPSRAVHYDTCKSHPTFKYAIAD
jgi:hypothetical protein